MNNVAINQAYLFFIFILNGILIGIIFDIFRILRRSFYTSNIITYIEDVIFWMIATISVLYTLFVYNNGEIRGYVFIALFLGITLYMLFFSKTIVKISVKIIVFVKNIIYKIVKTVLCPLKVIIHILKKIFIIPYKFLVGLCLKMTNNLKKCHKFKIKPKKYKKLEDKEGF